MAINQRNAFIVLILITILSTGSAIYFARKASDPAKMAEIARAKAEAEVKSLVSQVGKVIALPENETPTVATVADPDKLKDQPFFVHAKVGDLVLIYPTSQKAILWNPTSKKIIEVSPLTIISSPQDAGTAPTSNKKAN